MNELYRDDIPQVTTEENAMLVAPFSKDEVRAAINQMNYSTTPSPNGFPPEFHQVFWHEIKDDQMALFREFHKGELPLHILNFGTIILLQKRIEAKQIQQYRPILLTPKFGSG